MNVISVIDAVKGFDLLISWLLLYGYLASFSALSLLVGLLID